MWGRRGRGAQANPPRVPPGVLPASEQATVDLFERNTYGVVNIIDVTIRSFAMGGPTVSVAFRPLQHHLA